MEQLYHKTNRRVMEVQERLNSMASCHDSGTFEMLNQQISEEVKIISADLDHLDNQVAREMGVRKVSVKMKVEQLRGDLKHIQNAIRGINNKR